MGRLLLLVLLVVAIVWLLKRAFGEGEPERDAPRQRPPVQGDLVTCARCGVHLPRTEARESSGALFCSEEHARLGKA